MGCGCFLGLPKRLIQSYTFSDEMKFILLVLSIQTFLCYNIINIFPMTKANDFHKIKAGDDIMGYNAKIRADAMSLNPMDDALFTRWLKA